MMKLFLVLAFLSTCFAFNKHDGYGTLKDRYSHLENIKRKLDHENYLLQNSLSEKSSTQNEVEDFDYFMDEKEVQRAWAKSEQHKKHQDQWNTHFVKKAMENVKLVLENAKCKEPTRRCLEVNKMDLGKSKRYWPNCALVHKCDHDSGCCTNPDHACSPVKSDTIELVFFSIVQSREKQSGRVELMTFENHTLCDCRPRPSNFIMKKPIDCLCPKHFSPVVSSLECRCDCDVKQSKACRRVKKGKRSYHSKAKGCRGKCGVPACDYGDFLKDFGRCPRKNNKGKRRK